MNITDIKVTVKTRNDVCQTPVTDLGIDEVINRVEKLNAQLAKFWSSCDGWAPVEAAGLLGKSRLDWQVSLSGSLRLWISSPESSLTPAELILAWANLGSLIEGVIKLFLSAYHHVYVADIDNLKKVNAFSKKKQAPLPPDGLRLEQLRLYCAVRKILDADDLALVELIQQRRNAIHAFKDRPIGDEAEFQQAVRGYLQMTRNIIARLPYPGDEYVPVE
jgi:hypothetical protein